MKNRSISKGFGSAIVILLTAMFAPGLNGWQPAQANATPISTQPIFITPTSTDQVKPNIFMVLDDSGSMDWDYMPDTVRNFDQDGSGNKKYGFPSSQCNGIYYNPSITYTPPVDPAGASYANSSFTNAAKDGYDLTLGYVDLSSSFTAFSGDTSQAAYYYKYTGGQTAEAKKLFYNTGSIFYKECNSLVGATTAHDGTNPVNTLFTKVLVSATSGPGGTDERVNFSNWYTYYRTRMQMMKTATGLAFKTIDDNFRVGFTTLHGNATLEPGFLNIADFTAAQKKSFYSSLYASIPNNGTPLRETLSNAGRLYAGKVGSIHGVTVVDPVQYSCQQNYTILSTDGFWNGNGGVKLNGSTSIGNEDGSLPRPYFDGASVTTTIVTPYTLTKDYPKTTATTTAKTWNQTTTAIGAACTTTVSNTKTAPMSVKSSSTGALGLAASNPNSSRCVKLGSGSGAATAWFCRSGTNDVSQASVTDSTGVTWKLASVTGNSGCVTAQAAFGSNYYSSVGACPAVSGFTVTTTPSSQTETTVSEITSLDRYTASQTTTQTTVNGVAGPVGPLTPSTPVYTLSSNLGTTTSDSHTCGGQPAPCPSSGGTWTAGATTNVCKPTASLPAPGTSTPTAGTAATTTSTTSGAVVASSGPTAGTPTTTTVSSGGTSNTLADVAAYYYNTPLRTTALGNCSPAGAKNNLCTGGPNATTEDPATWQHMTTFTLGLGTRGRMVYSDSYPLDAEIKTPSDYTDIFYGNNATSATTCTWRDTLTTAGAACNWPVPGADKIENVDDMWHTAVNGHGKYYAASDPGKLASGLAQTLKFIVDQPKPGTAASAATTNPKVTENSNYQFSSFFLSVEWSGDLIRQTKDLQTGKAPTFDLLKREAGTYDWSSREKLDAQTYTTRNIYFNQVGAATLLGGATRSSAADSTGGLAPFTWANVTTGSVESYFTAPGIATSPPGYPNQLTGLTQFCASGSVCISSTAQTNTTVATGGAAGEALVNFLRGDRGNEEGTIPDTTKFFRHRAHVLGDIVSAQPQYSGTPKWSYSDSGYAAFKTANASRQQLVFAAANDGMLHAFDAGTGAEVWAYIPTFVLPRLYTLADKQYADKHQYFVEGTPQVGDICPKAPATCAASDWRTILVGGLNSGGTGYYALDITNPTSPQLLWEFTDNDIGYTFSNPQIAKLSDGTWAVMVTSGYNNCPKLATAAQQDCARNGTGDGRGYLYVLNAGSGAMLAKISTGVGSATAPSGLGKIVAHIDSSHTTTRVYGGDLLGNLWRFNIGGGVYSVQSLATLKDAAGVAQPIMSKPVVTTVNSLPVVYIGTGRYLHTSDIGSTQIQSYYAIKDQGTSYGSPRSSSNFMVETAVPGTCPGGTDVSICSPGDPVRTLTQDVGVAGDSLVNKDGWILDFPAGAGELQFTDSKLVLGTITFSTSIPAALMTTDACRASLNPQEGLSFNYQLNYLNGGVVGNSPVAGTGLGSGIATAPQVSVLEDGRVIVTTRMSGGNDKYIDLRRVASLSAAKRVSWRELVSD